MGSLTQTDVTNLNKGNSYEVSFQNLGHKIGRVRCVFDAAGGKAVTTHGLGLTIPKNSYVTKAYYKVITTFTTASADSGTIALQVAGANDLVSAIAVSDGSNVWDSGGMVICIPSGSMANEVSVTADSEVSAVVGTAALTAGKLALWIEYEYYGDLV